MSSFAEQLQEIKKGETAFKKLPEQSIGPWLRRALQYSVLPFVWLESGVQAFFKKWLSHSKRRGRCIQTGACCKTIVVYLSPFEVAVPWLRKITLWWAVEINGFYEKASQLEVPEGDLRVFGCRHLTENGLCADYGVRPSVCRAWPRQEYFTQSRVFKGCGYAFAQKKKRTSSVDTAKKPLPVVNDK